jgi:hypothetical protein
MKPKIKPPRKRAGRRPKGLPRLNTAQFTDRSVYSRQHADMKAAVRRVVVEGVHVTDVANALGQSRQNVHDGVMRFLATTAEPMQRMAPHEFAYASRLRRNPNMVHAARLYLVEGYSVPEACKVAGAPDMQVKDLVKRMRSTIRRVAGALPPLGKGEVYTGPHPDWQWPTADEMNALAASCFVRSLSDMTYTRAHMVLVLKMAPSQVTKLTNSTLQFVINSVDSVVAQLGQYRAHIHFPKDAAYLSDLSQAMDKKATKPGIRFAIEAHLVHGIDLDTAANSATLASDVFFRAVRTTIHEMARARKKRL